MKTGLLTKQDLLQRRLKSYNLKLTTPMLRALCLLSQGWDLFISNRFEIYFLQKGGIGNGGDTEKYRVTTYRGLLKMKLIEYSHPSFPGSVYQITELGRDYIKTYNQIHGKRRKN